MKVLKFLGWLSLYLTIPIFGIFWIFWVITELRQSFTEIIVWIIMLVGMFFLAKSEVYSSKEGLLWLKAIKNKLPSNKTQFESLWRAMPSVLPSLLLLVALTFALLEWSDYGVYNLIRLVVCSTSVWLAFKSEKNGKIQKAWIFGVMAATFNPFLPLKLGREVWIWVDWFSILVVVGDLICLSSPPVRKKLSTLLCASIVFWGLFLGVKYYSVEVLLPHSKAAAEKREAEERRSKELDRLELDRLMGELPSWDSPRRPPIELLPNVDYSK